MNNKGTHVMRMNRILTRSSTYSDTTRDIFPKNRPRGDKYHPCDDSFPFRHTNLEDTHVRSVLGS